MATTPLPINDERAVRLSRLEALRQQGINPYPERFQRTHTALEAREAPADTTVTVAGRILSRRVMGQIVFCHILDASGQIQLVLRADELAADQFQLFVDYFDTADFIGAQGTTFATQRGEPSVLVKDFSLLGKALLPLPEKWHGLADIEAKYRQRYLDLITDQETRDRFSFRSDVIRALREFYWAEGFREVETPTFLHQATGATATPYQTHHNALDMDIYLRISHELPLKELIVGGMERIFELGKAYRNEGIDPSHLPEHTHLEHYCAYWNFEDNIAFTEKMFAHLFDQLGLEREMDIINREGEKVRVNWATPWPRVNYIELIKQDTNLDILEYTDAAELLKDIKKRKISFEGMDDMSLPGLVDNLYKKVSRPKLINPTILYGYPKYLQPLARPNDADPRLVDQFQLVVNGWEVVKAYSELVDPIDQQARFAEQAQAQAKGEDEVMVGDDEYITAMEHGMPPISGWGMGVDRLVALLTQQDNLRDVVLFPLLRRKE